MANAGALPADQPLPDAVYADGSDGAVTLDGAATPAWATRAGSVYTMTRDCYCTNLTLNAGVTLITSGFRVFCTGTLTTNATAIIHNDGNAAVGQLGGVTAGDVNGWYARVTGGPAGGDPTFSGSPGPAQALLQGGTGGTGGAGGGGGAGAAAGTSIAPAFIARDHISALMGIWPATGAQLLAGQRGASGGGGSTGAGGGGGGPGGAVFIAARILVHAGAIRSRGGAGGAGGAANGGGGGGGGGGIVWLIYGVKTGAGTTDANGGAAGVKAGTGVNGGAGANGRVVELMIG